MQKILFLDLEDTVIDRFDDGQRRTAVNHAQVRQFLQVEQPDEVRLFSFALSGEASLQHLHTHWKDWLGSALGVAIEVKDTFTTRKLFELCRKHGTVFENELECMLFHSKQFGFQHFIELSPQFHGTEVVLLDDAVEPCVMHFPRRNQTLRMVNVADLPLPPQHP